MNRVYKLRKTAAVVAVFFVSVIGVSMLGQARAAAFADLPDLPPVPEENEQRTLQYPAELLDLMFWKLKAPVDTAHAGAPDEIRNPWLQTYTTDFFKLNAAQDGVIMKAHAGGYTTSGSQYPRTQLGEAQESGRTRVWNSFDGKHSLFVRMAITHLPEVKPDMNVAQIHDSNSYAVAVVIRGETLRVEGNIAGLPATLAVLDPKYELGREFTIEFTVENGWVAVDYNGSSVVTTALLGWANYFTSGAYVLTNPSKGDMAEAYGEILLKELKTSHQ